MTDATRPHALPRREVGIVGYGQSKYSKSTGRTLLSLLAEAGIGALASAGMSKGDVDGLAVCSFDLPPDNAATLAEQFGLSISWGYLGTAGGAGPVASLLNAIRAIDAGHASAVLCLAGDAYDVAGHYRMMDNFNRALRNYGAPNGFGGANGLFAIIQRKHMETFGTTRAQLGRIAIGQRASAVHNDNALFRKPLSLEEYLDARVIADPLHLFDCVMPCSGAEAVLVAALDKVPKGCRVRVLAGYERHNHPPAEIAPIRGGWELFRDRLFEDAGLGPQDIDLVQAYDDYPIMVAIQLEDLGFCRKGEVGTFLEENSFSYDGTFPLNTNGGQLSCGQAGAGGGMIGLTEAVRQLRHEALGHQVAQARLALVSGYGMVGYGHGLSASAVVLEGIR